MVATAGLLLLLWLLMEPDGFGWDWDRRFIVVPVVVGQESHKSSVVQVTASIHKSCYGQCRQDQESTRSIQSTTTQAVFVDKVDTHNSCRAR